MMPAPRTSSRHEPARVHVQAGIHSSPGHTHTWPPMQGTTPSSLPLEKFIVAAPTAPAQRVGRTQTHIHTRARANTHLHQGIWQKVGANKVVQKRLSAQLRPQHNTPNILTHTGTHAQPPASTRQLGGVGGAGSRAPQIRTGAHWPGGARGVHRRQCSARPPRRPRVPMHRPLAPSPLATNPLATNPLATSTLTAESRPPAPSHAARCPPPTTAGSLGRHW